MLRIFETLLLVSLTGCVLFGRDPNVTVFSDAPTARGLLGLLFVLHLYYDRARPQMYTAYAVAVLQLLSGPGVSQSAFHWLFALQVLLLLVSALLCFIMPVARLPKPSGPFNVGKLEEFIPIDDKVTHASVVWKKGQNREPLRVVAFYPTVEARDGYLSRNDNRYLPPILAKHLADYPRLPPVVFQHAPLAKPAVKWQAEPMHGRACVKRNDDKKFPVVIFSHGLGAIPEVYTALVTDLASHGFVVLCPSHSDGSAAAVLAQDQSLLRKHRFMSASEKTEEFEFRNSQLSHRVAEVTWLLNMLQKPKKETLSALSPKFVSLLGVCDVDQISLKGHSFGAATAYQTVHDLHDAKESERVQTVILHDIWTFPLTPSTKSSGTPDTVPLFFLHSEEWMQYGNTTLNMLRTSRHEQTRFYSMKHARHTNFADVGLFSPIISQRLGTIGKLVDPIHALREMALFSSTWLKHVTLQDSKEMDHLESEKAENIQPVSL